MFAWLKEALGSLSKKLAERRRKAKQEREVKGLHAKLLNMLGPLPPLPDKVEEVLVGKIRCDSGRLTFFDPGTLSDCNVGEVPIGLHEVRVRHFGVRNLKVMIVFRNGEAERQTVLGTVPIDLARVVVVDSEAYLKHWDHTGPLREGILTGQPDKVSGLLLLLSRRFKVVFDPVRDGWWKCRTPISRELEGEIRTVIEENPELRSACRLEIRTGSSKEKAIDKGGTWGEVVLDAASGTSALVFHTGYGDGCYDVVGNYSGSELLSISIEFISEEEIASHNV